MQHLSQGVLNAWMTCPRQFQHWYLDCLVLPANPNQQARMAWGSRFHWLMQQSVQFAGADRPPDRPSLADGRSADAEELALRGAIDRTWAQLQGWLDRADAADPALSWTLDAEHRRTKLLGDRLLTVVYDLLALHPEGARIFDWKTHARPVSRDRLKQDWQTRLYLYVLAETIDLPPDRLSMSYWFVRPATGSDLPGDADADPAAPTVVEETFEYSRQWHRTIQRQLTEAADQIDRAIAAYRQGESLPQVPLNSPACRSCAFVSRCGRDATPAADAPGPSIWQRRDPSDPSIGQLLDEVAEIVL